MRTENIRRDKVVDFRASIVKLTLFVEKNRKQKYNNLAAIAACLQQDTTEEEIVNTLCARFDGDREVIKADVAEAVKKLREIGVIDE